MKDLRLTGMRAMGSGRVVVFSGLITAVLLAVAADFPPLIVIEDSTTPYSSINRSHVRGSHVERSLLQFSEVITSRVYMSFMSFSDVEYSSVKFSNLWLQYIKTEEDEKLAIENFREFPMNVVRFSSLERSFLTDKSCRDPRLPPNSTVERSAMEFSSIRASRLTLSDWKNSEACEAVSLNSYVLDSYLKASVLTDSTVKSNSNVFSSQITGSLVINSNLTECTIINSQIEGKNLTNVKIVNNKIIDN